jgi:hypothetical protein
MLEQAAGGTLFVLVAFALAVLCAFAILEAWMLYTTRKPITGYVRDAISAYPKRAAAIAFVAGLLAGHFWR